MTEIPEAGYEMLDHPADLRFRIWAPDLASLFRQAARTLTETLFPDEESPDGGQTLAARIEVNLEGVDPADLLVRWLGELHFQAETRGLVPQAITFQQLDQKRLLAECIMRRADTPGCEIKAITYHQTGIRNTVNGVEATLLFDV